MLLSNDVEISDLTKTIKSLQQEMIHTGLKEGLTHKKTIELSQKLDKYIARYQVIMH